MAERRPVFSVLVSRTRLTLTAASKSNAAACLSTEYIRPENAAPKKDQSVENDGKGTNAFIELRH